MSNRKIYKEAVLTFGHNAQINVAVEDCAELIQAIQKFKRELPHNVPEKMADVEIMIQQLKLIFPGMAECKKEKLIKLQELIQQRKGLPA